MLLLFVSSHVDQECEVVLGYVVEPLKWVEEEGSSGHPLFPVAAE